MPSAQPAHRADSARRRGRVPGRVPDPAAGPVPGRRGCVPDHAAGPVPGRGPDPAVGPVPGRRGCVPDPAAGPVPGRRGRVSMLRRAVALALVVIALAACDAGTVEQTPAITPGSVGAPREVNVIMRDYQFLPGIVDLVPGETVTLNAINGGLDVHELVLGPADVQAAWEAAEEPAANPPPGATPGVSVPPGLEGLRLVVDSGQTATVTYTVPDDLGEQLLLGCHISDHWERGMAGAVRLVGPGGVPLPAVSPADR